MERPDSAGEERGHWEAEQRSFTERSSGRVQLGDLGEGTAGRDGKFPRAHDGVSRGENISNGVKQCSEQHST